MKKFILIAMTLVALSTSAQFGSPFNQSALYINQQIPFCPSVDSCLGLGGTDTTLVLSKSGAFVHMSSGGGGVSDTIQCQQSITVNISAAQILASHSNPPVIIPAPGSGRYIQLINGAAAYNYVGTSYTNFNSTGLIEGDTNFIISQNFNISAVSNNYSPSLTSTSIASQQTSYVNKPVKFYTQGADPTDGDGTIQISYLYSVLDVAGHTICSNDTFRGGVITDTINIQCLRTKYYRLTSSEILSSFSSPVTIIPSPGAGKYIQLVNGSGTYSHGGTDYSSANQSGITVGDINSFAGGTIDITRPATVYNPTIVTGNANGQDLAFLNKPIVFYTQTANPTLGDGTVEFQLQYIVIDAVTHTMICPTDTFLGVSSLWSINGNADTDPSVNLLGTTDSAGLRIEANTPVNSGVNAVVINGSSGSKAGISLNGLSQSNRGVSIDGTSLTGTDVGLSISGTGSGGSDISISPTAGLLQINNINTDNSPVAIYTKGADGFMKESSPPTLQSVCDAGDTLNHHQLKIYNDDGENGISFYNFLRELSIILNNGSTCPTITLQCNTFGNVVEFGTHNITANITNGDFQGQVILEYPHTAGGGHDTITISVNGIKADSAGNVHIGAGDVGAATLSQADSIATANNKAVYQYSTPTTGQTVNSNGAEYLVINPAGALLALTVGFPSSPVDGQLFNLSSTQAVTTITLTSSGTIDGTLTGIAANGTAGWIYIASITTWVKTHN